MQVGTKVPSSIYVDPERLDLTFQDTADPSVEAGRVLVVEVGLGVGLVIDVDELNSSDGSKLISLASRDAKQAIHESPDLTHGVARDAEASGELPDVAPGPREDACSDRLLRWQERRICARTSSGSLLRRSAAGSITRGGRGAAARAIFFRCMQAR